MRIPAALHRAFIIADGFVLTLGGDHLHRLRSLRPLVSRPFFFQRDVDREQVTLIVLAVFDLEVVAGLQGAGLDVLTIFAELGSVRALQIDDACILGLDDYGLVVQFAEHALHVLQNCLVLFFCGGLFLASARHGDAADTSRWVLPRWIAASRRIAAGRILCE